MTSIYDTAMLGTLVEISKGLSYKGMYLDQPGPALLGLGAVQPGGGFRAGSVRTYGGPFKPKHAVSAGDLVIALTDLTQEGQVLGSPVTVPVALGPTLITHHVAVLRPKPEAGVDMRYLYYALCSPSSRDHFRSMATGTTVRAVSPSDAGRVSLPLPPLTYQGQIANILGALDDKIALNYRLATTLEDTASALFKEFCLNLASCAPQAIITQAPPLPAGWRMTRLDALVEFDPRVRLRKGERAIFVDMKSLPTSGSSVTEWATRDYCGGARFCAGDTLFARITPCLENGKSALVDFLREGEVGFGSSEFIVLRPKKGTPRAWPYCLVRDERFRAYAIANMTGSSGRQRVSAATLADYSVPLPPLRSLRAFETAADPLFARITSCAREARTLRAIRDSLLPRLVFGAIQPAAADRVLANA